MTSHTTTGDPTGDPAGRWTGDPRQDATGDPRQARTGQAGRGDAVIAGAGRLTDALLEVGEALVAALIGAVSGAGRTAAGIWVADRPRRQMVRMARRRRWIQRGGRWWLLAVLELVVVGALLGGRAAVRAARGMPSGAAKGARTGWDTGRDRARTRRGAPTGPGSARGTPGPAWGPRPATGPGPSPSAGGQDSGQDGGRDGEVIVDAEVLCGRTGCGTVLAQDDPGPLCPACRQARAERGDDVQITVEVVSPTGPASSADPDTGPDPASPEETVTVAGTQDGPARTPYERTLTPEQLADFRRLAGLRNAGYLGAVDRDGYPVASMNPDAARLTPAQVEAAIAAGGYPPEGRPWPGGDRQVPRPTRTPQSPAGPVAGGSAGQHDQQDGPGHLAGPGSDESQEDGMPPTSTTDSTEMTIKTGAGGTSVTGGTRMGQQLTAVGDLRAEVTELRMYAETGMQLLTDLEAWAAGLPDQVAGAEWSTEAVTAAAVGLAEARTVEEVRSGITGLLSAAAEAERLGEQLAAGGARKGVAGLRPQ